jgi:hypothetical protein
MQHRWHYIYVILYPELGYKFYYGSRITAKHPEDDVMYFGSSKTFKRYNDINDAEYQITALKVILWAAKLPHCKKNTRQLNELETKLIRDALTNVEHLGPDVCLNRSYAGRPALTPQEQREIGLRVVANGGGFFGMSKRRHMHFAKLGGHKSHAMGAGVHGISKEQLADAQKRGRATIVARYSKTYTFINPAGQSVTFTNLKQFCRDNDLNPGHMRSLNSGRLKTHKGWKKAC